MRLRKSNVEPTVTLEFEGEQYSLREGDTLLLSADVTLVDDDNPRGKVKGQITVHSLPLRVVSID